MSLTVLAVSGDDLGSKTSQIRTPHATRMMGFAAFEEDGGNVAKRTSNERARGAELVVNGINHQANMVKKRLINLVNVALLSNGGGGMLVRVVLVCGCGLGAQILGTGRSAAEDLAPEQASAFVVGKLFSYTCFEGTAGTGRIFPDGSVIGTIRIRGEGETRFAALPPGTIRVDGPAVCAHLSGLPITPCFKVQKIDNRSFRGSVAGLDFAYCDFYQPANSPATPITAAERSMRLSFHE